MSHTWPDFNVVYHVRESIVKGLARRWFTCFIWWTTWFLLAWTAKRLVHPEIWILLFKRSLFETDLTQRLSLTGNLSRSDVELLAKGFWKLRDLVFHRAILLLFLIYHLLHWIAFSKIFGRWNAIIILLIFFLVLLLRQLLLFVCTLPSNLRCVLIRHFCAVKTWYHLPSSWLEHPSIADFFILEELHQTALLMLLQLLQIISI